jgi:hypothetical protein
MIVLRANFYSGLSFLSGRPGTSGEKDHENSKSRFRCRGPPDGIAVKHLRGVCEAAAPA